MPERESPPGCAVLGAHYVVVQASTPPRPIGFYQEHYVYLSTPSYLSPDMTPIFLGDRCNRVCRFCSQIEPDVSFSHKAHAIPESLGNKCLYSAYECDDCNQHFGKTIDNVLGNWSIVNRTLSGIRGKRKIPTLKGGGSNLSWRITRSESGLSYKEYGSCSTASIDEELKEVKLELRGGSYTPIAVFKAFAKIGLTLLPDEEVKNFSETLSWVRNPDHSTGFVKNCSIVYTFVPGPMPSNVIVPRLLRRKPQSNNLPYIFLILGFGNCLIQIWLPCRKKDQHIWGTTLEVPPFPPVIAPKPTIYGSPSTRVLDMSGREQVTQENRSHRFRGTNIEIRG